MFTENALKKKEFCNTSVHFIFYTLESITSTSLTSLRSTSSDLPQQPMANKKAIMKPRKKFPSHNNFQFIMKKKKEKVLMYQKKQESLKRKTKT